MLTWKTCICLYKQNASSADNKIKRNKWINDHYHQFKACYGDYKVVDKTVVIALSWMDTVKMATATPTKNDKFNLRTGIAVAYAKACSERIPDFV